MTPSQRRIEQCFARCRGEGRAALVGYLTAFDPDHDRSLAQLDVAVSAGLDIVEIGVPFSDPAADGPEIQAAMVRALQAGSTLDGVLEIAAQLRRRHPALPIVLFSYANPLLRRGAASICGRAIDAGIDAFLAVDLPPENSALLRDPARAAGLDWIGLVAPTSPPNRVRRITGASSGFVYAVSLTGVTGAALDASAGGLDRQLDELRRSTELPVAVGFGIREPHQVKALAPKVDAVVVGSALVRAARVGDEALARTVAALRAATSSEQT